jgi:hypothetical protein
MATVARSEREPTGHVHAPERVIGWPILEPKMPSCSAV